MSVHLTPYPSACISIMKCSFEAAVCIALEITASRRIFQLSPFSADLYSRSLIGFPFSVDDVCSITGLIKVCLSGGDPFSKKNVWELIDYLYRKGLAIDIFTNGQSIVNDIQRLVDYYPRTIGISIYSGVPSVHDYITRIKGSWEKSISVVKQLSSYAVPTNLKCCVMRPNVKSYYMVADIADEYGAVPQFEISLTDSI